VRIGDPTRAPAVDHSARDVHNAAQRHQPKHDLRAGQSLTLRSAMPPLWVSSCCAKLRTAWVSNSVSFGASYWFASL
jgi:hypothetical protein